MQSEPAVNFSELNAAYEKGLDQGLECLTGRETHLYWSMDFISQWLNGGMTGYFYNRLPDHSDIICAIKGLNKVGLNSASDTLSKAYDPWRNYMDPDPSEGKTWGDMCSQYDPAGLMEQLETEMGKHLEGY